MPSIAEKRILDAEEDALRAELEWMFSDDVGEVQRVFAELRRLLKSCYERLSGKGEGGPDAGGQPQGYHSCPLTMENDTVKGFVTLYGHSITKASLQLKFHKIQKGQPVSTSITPEAPWIVYQIQNAANHLLLAHTEICNSSDQLRALEQSGSKGASGCDHLIQTRDYVCQAMDKLMQQLNRAKDQLVRPQKTTVAEAASELTNQSVWKPKLPDGVIVHFHVDYANLITDVYALSHMHHTPSAPKPTQCKIGSRWYEVEEHVELESSIPSLGDSLAQINTAYELCQRLKDNLKALSAVTA